MNGKQILIIDDDVAFTEMLAEILKAEGAEVMVEHDGAAGIEQALRVHPDMLLIDVMMPRMSGISVLEQLRGDDWGKGVPALLLTNMTQPEAMAASMEKGPPTEYLLKTDWTLDQISEKVKQLLATQE